MFFGSKKKKPESVAQLEPTTETTTLNTVEEIAASEVEERAPVDSAVVQSAAQEPMVAAERQAENVVDFKRRGAAASKHLQASFGQIVSLLMRTNKFKGTDLSALETSVLPAIVSGQYLIAEKQSEKNGFSAPVAVILWANVSDETDARLSQDQNALHNLSFQDWSSGSHTWIITSVGDQVLLRGMLDKLRKTTLVGRTIKLYAVDNDGTAAPIVLDGLKTAS